MEVHHHAHKPKNWKEYITEFLMLFTAVTLGFFAENFREHQVITHRIEQNKAAILKDLEQDSVVIAGVLADEERYSTKFSKILDLLYLAKNKKISQFQLIDSIKEIPNIYAKTYTLYVNNSSFKNMQSSGLLSYLEEGELKNALSSYYEVDFKAIEAGNDFFDHVGIEFNNYLPIGVGTAVRKNVPLSKEYVLNDPDKYLDFMLNLDKTKKILQSEEFIYETQKYYNYIFIYQNAVKKAKKQNDELIKLLKLERN